MKITRIIFFIFISITTSAYSETYEEMVYSSVLTGYSLGIALWVIGRLLSYGVELIKHALEAPKE